MPVKRKATSPVRPSPSKKAKAETTNGQYNHNRIAEDYGIVQRAFYPPELSNQRCEQYNKGDLPRPIELLTSAISDTKSERSKIKADKCVVHWFKRDLRISDNRALSLASDRAKRAGVPLVCVFLLSPQDYEAHLTSAARVDFERRTLEVMQQDLAELNIPLFIDTVEKKKDVTTYLVAKFEEWGAAHVYCNIEYEVDELRREAKLVKKCLEKAIDFNAIHDDVVVSPGNLKSGAGNQYSVYSPWYRAWVTHVHEHPDALKESGEISANPQSARNEFKDLFSTPIPPAPENKRLSDEDAKRLASLWPAGEHAARERLDRFLQEKIKSYQSTRNFPAANSTSLLSVHFAVGTLSARTAVRAARDANSTKKLDGGDPGIKTWISEVAWRDFYKHVMCNWPYVCMNKPFKYEYADIEWEYNDEQFERWCSGHTGFPIVDAAMRQLNSMAWMHNRVRMVVACFLAKDLLIDWRMGEKYFMEHLIDGDFASNNGGWGFSASTGVDPQPYFRIFNPTLQSEKFDAEGEYIRKWVPELKDVQGKAIHNPYGRGAAKLAEKAGYPKPMVDHSEARKKALDRYKNGLGRGTANVGGGVHN